MPIAEPMSKEFWPQVNLASLLQAAMVANYQENNMVMQPVNFCNSLNQQMLPTNLTVKTEFEDSVGDSSKEKQFPEHCSSSVSSSPQESAGRSDSPASTVGSLPKESSHAERKRPAAIQELLQSKKARLESTKLKSEPMSDYSQCDSQTSPPNVQDRLMDTINRIANGEFDNETVSSVESSESGTDKAPSECKDSKDMSFKENQQSPGPRSYIPSGANDNGVLEIPFNGYVPLETVFAQVPGRLSLLSNVVKYKMTVGEVKRRLMGPEAFNFSLLGALLRRAKMPEKSQMLVMELASVGMSIARGRRRMSSVTLLSALTESESLQLAKDFQSVSEKEFPIAQLSDHSLKTYLAKEIVHLRPNDYPKAIADNRLKQLQDARNMASEFVALLNLDRSPVCEKNEDPVLDPTIQDPLSTYSMLTHGFGSPAILVGMQMFLSFLNCQIDKLSSSQTSF